MKGEGNRVEVERLPHLSELAHEGQAVEIASVQDPETGATRYKTISSNRSLPPTSVVILFGSRSGFGSDMRSKGLLVAQLRLYLSSKNSLHVHSERLKQNYYYILNKIFNVKLF
jgi:hypothetical protein